MAFVTKNKIVSIHYEVRDNTMNIIDSNKGYAPLEYLHGANNILPALEKELEGLTMNEEKEIPLQPSQTYGEYDATLVYEANAEELNISVQQLQEGAIVELGGKEWMITAIKGSKATLDGNHLLAGKTLSYHVKVITIRAATPEEIMLGYPLTHQIRTCGPGCNC